MSSLSARPSSQNLTLPPAFTQEGKFCPGPRKKEQKDLPKKEDPFTVKRQICFKRKIPDRGSEESERKKKIPDQRSEESKKRNSQPKIGRKQKKRKRKGNSLSRLEEDKEVNRKVFRLDNIWTKYENVTSKKGKKGNRDLRHMKLSPPWLPTKLLCAGEFFRPALNKNREKEQVKMPRAKFPTKNTVPEKSLLIHDHACNLWFDRKWFAKSSHDISMVWN